MSGTPFSAASGTGSSTASAGSDRTPPPAGPGLPPGRHRDGNLGLPAPRAAEERSPSGPSEPQHRAARIPAVADADPAAGEFGYLDAVAVGEAEGTLIPGRVHLLTPHGRMLPARSRCRCLDSYAPPLCRKYVRVY